MQHSSNKDKFFSQFIIDLPEIPSEEVERLGEMCLNPEQYVLPRSFAQLMLIRWIRCRVQIGFAALRDLAALRPTVRDEALDVLLSLTTHSGMPSRLSSSRLLREADRPFV